MTWLRKLQMQIRHSIWYPAVTASFPSFVISLAWNHGDTHGIVGLIVGFVAIEGLVILILIIARPATQAERILKYVNSIEIDTSNAKVLVGKIKADVPPAELAGKWRQAFPKLKSAWTGLLQESEKALSSDALNPNSVGALTDVFTFASTQIQAMVPSGGIFEIHTLKEVATYLERPEAKEVTRVRVVNRTRPAQWFTPQMMLYFCDLFRLSRKHPQELQFIRLSIVEDEERQRINDPEWYTTEYIDLLKAFVAINQMAGVKLKILTRGEFTKVVEHFITTKEEKIREIANSTGSTSERQKRFVRNAAFIMYCKGEQPIEVFRGRPDSSHAFPSFLAGYPHEWTPIRDPDIRALFYELFVALEEVSSEVPLVNLAETH